MPAGTTHRLRCSRRAHSMSGAFDARASANPEAPGRPNRACNDGIRKFASTTHTFRDVRSASIAAAVAASGPESASVPIEAKATERAGAPKRAGTHVRQDRTDSSAVRGCARASQRR